MARGWGNLRLFEKAPFKEDLSEEVIVILNYIDHQLCDSFTSLHSQVKKLTFCEFN